MKDPMVSISQSAADTLSSTSRSGTEPKTGWVSPYKILSHFKALLWESIILVLPPPNCNAYPIAILLHAHFAIYVPHRPTFCML